MYDLNQFSKIPIEKASQSPEKSGLYQLIKNHYWIATENNEILLYNKFAPQCNSNKSIVEYMLEKRYKGCHIEILENVYIKHRCE